MFLSFCCLDLDLDIFDTSVNFWVPAIKAWQLLESVSNKWKASERCVAPVATGRSYLKDIQSGGDHQARLGVSSLSTHCSGCGIIVANKPEGTSTEQKLDPAQTLVHQRIFHSMFQGRIRRTSHVLRFVAGLSSRLGCRFSITSRLDFPTSGAVTLPNQVVRGL